jgi:hypothetical protein
MVKIHACVKAPLTKESSSRHNTLSKTCSRDNVGLEMLGNDAMVDDMVG